MNTVLNDIEPHNLILNDGSQYRSESPTLEVAGYEQHYALIEARNDDDDDTIHLPNFIWTGQLIKTLETLDKNCIWIDWC